MSSEHNSVYCFSTVFISLQKWEVPQYLSVPYSSLHILSPSILVWLKLDCDKLISNTLFLFFRINTLLYVRILLDIVHSIILWYTQRYPSGKDHSTSSRNRYRGNKGNIKSRQRGVRGSDSVSYNQIWVLQNEWLLLRTSARTLLNIHCLRVTIS